MTASTLPRLAACRVVAAMLAVAAPLGWWLGFAYDGRDLNVVAGVMAFLLAVAWIARRRGRVRTAAAIEGSVVMLAACVATAILTAEFATSAFPYRDDALARGDALLFGPGWPALHRWSLARPALVAALRAAYDTLAWQPFAIVGLLAAAGRIDRVWRLAFAWTIALVACAAIFPFVPALGPYIHFGLAPDTTPLLTAAAPGWRAPQVLAALREGTLTTIGASQLTGLVAFPSFHTAGAVVLAWAALSLPRLIAVPVVALNVAIVASTPIVGSHYLVDTLGGLVLAALAIRAQYARATANSTASTIASFASPGANMPSASIAR